MVYTADIQQLVHMRKLAGEYLSDIIADDLPESYLNFSNFVSDENLYSITAPELKPILSSVSINLYNLNLIKKVNKEFIKMVIRGLNLQPSKKLKKLLKDIGYNHLN